MLIKMTSFCVINFLAVDRVCGAIKDTFDCLLLMQTYLIIAPTMIPRMMRRLKYRVVDTHYY
jgi:hypothetical protein